MLLVAVGCADSASDVADAGTLDATDPVGSAGLIERLAAARTAGNLVVGVTQDADGNHVVRFEEGTDLIIRAGVVRNVDVRSEAWNVRFELADGTRADAGYLGQDVPIASTDILVDPFGTAPLSALLWVTLPVETGISIRVHGQDGMASDWELPAGEYTALHARPIVGLYPDTTNQVTLSLTRRDGTVRRSKTLTLLTGPLPAGVPKFVVRTPYAVPERNVGFLVNYRPLYYPLLADAFGKVRWMLVSPEAGERRGMQQLANGLFGYASIRDNAIRVYSWDGLLLQDLPLPAPWERPHHDVFELPNGNLLVTVEETGAATIGDIIIEMDRASGQVVQVWDLKDALPQDYVDLYLDPRDWVHVNGVVYDARDDAIIISARPFGIIKLTRDNQVVWVLGRPGWPADLQARVLSLAPGSETVWGQHAPELTPNGNVMVFDNGFGRDYGAAPQFSRMVEFAIDEANLTATQVFEYGRDRPELFSPIVSDVDTLASGNRLMVSGATTRISTYVDPTQVSATWADDERVKAWIIEVDPSGQPVFEMTVETEGIANGSVYRAEKLVLTP